MSEDKKNTGQISELKTQLIDCQDSLQNLVFQKSMQQLEDISQIKGLKSEQIKNVLGYSSRGEVIHANNMVISENE